MSAVRSERSPRSAGEPLAAAERAERPPGHRAAQAVEAEQGVVAEHGAQEHEGVDRVAGRQQPVEVHGGLAGLLLGQVGLVGRVQLGANVRAEVLQRQVDGLREDELRDRTNDRHADAGTDVELADLLPGRPLGVGGALGDALVHDEVADGRADPERGVDQLAHDLVGLDADLLRLGERQGRGLVENDPHRPVGERGDVGLAVGVEALSGHDNSLHSSGLQPSAIGSHR